MSLRPPPTEYSSPTSTRAEHDIQVVDATTGTSARGAETGAGVRPPRRGTAPRLVRWVLVAALLVLTPSLIAFAVAAGQDEVFRAQTEVVYAGEGAAVPGRAEPRLDTELVVMVSRAVLGPTAQAFGTEVEQLEEAVTVEQLDDSEVIRLSVDSEDPERAQRIAESLVETYLADVERRETTRAEQDLLGARIAELQARHAQVDERLSDLSGGSGSRVRASSEAQALERTRLDDESRTVSQQIYELQGQVTELRLRDLEAGPPASVLTAAYTVDDPVAPRPWRAAAAGALVGLLLAGALVALAFRARPE